MWLGPLHDQRSLSAMYRIAAQSQTGSRCQGLIETMQAEADLPPYYYSLAEIGRRGKMDIPPREALLASLRQQGFSAVRTHIDTQAIKTDAPLKTCIQVAAQMT